MRKARLAAQAYGLTLVPLQLPTQLLEQPLKQTPPQPVAHSLLHPLRQMPPQPLEHSVLQSALAGCVVPMPKPSAARTGSSLRAKARRPGIFGVS